MDPHAPRDDVVDDPRAARPRRRPSCSPPTRWTRPSTSATASRIIDHGRLVACGTPKELTTRPRRRRDDVHRRRAGSPVDEARRTRSGSRADAVRELRPGDYVVDAPATPDAAGAPHRVAGRRRACCSSELRAGPALARGRVPAAHRRGLVRRVVKATAIRAQARIEMLLTLRRGESLLVTLGDPARDPRVLHVKVDAVNTTLQGSGRLPGARRARARGDVERDGEPRHRHRVRAALRRAEAPRVDAAVARRPAHREDPQRARARDGPGGR